MSPVRFDRRIQARRFGLGDDGFQEEEVFTDHGDPIWAARVDMNASEKADAGWVNATLATRFVVKSTSFTRDLTAKDQIASGGLEYEIIGISEIGRRYQLQIDCVALAEQ